MASTVRQDDEAITGINVTPLVDITLVLLIIFMVTARLIAGQGIPLDLPKAATAGVTQTTLTVAVDANGSISANGKPVVGEQALFDQARRAVRDNPLLRTVISASSATNHGSVMGVVDTLRKAGATRIAFAATKVESRTQSN